VKWFPTGVVFGIACVYNQFKVGGVGCSVAGEGTLYVLSGSTQKRLFVQPLPARCRSILRLVTSSALELPMGLYHRAAWLPPTPLLLGDHYNPLRPLLLKPSHSSATRTEKNSAPSRNPFLAREHEPRVEIETYQLPKSTVNIPIF